MDRAEKPRRQTMSLFDKICSQARKENSANHPVQAAMVATDFPNGKILAHVKLSTCKPATAAPESLVCFSSTTASITSVPIEIADESTVAPAHDPQDDRRFCRQCLNLRGRTCAIAAPGTLVSANRGYQPMLKVLHRCAGYLPNACDHDQRRGDVRWSMII